MTRTAPLAALLALAAVACGGPADAPRPVAHTHLENLGPVTTYSWSAPGVPQIEDRIEYRCDDADAQHESPGSLGSVLHCEWSCVWGHNDESWDAPAALAISVSVDEYGIARAVYTDRSAARCEAR